MSSLVFAMFHLLAVSNTGIPDIKQATAPGIGEGDEQVRRQGARVPLL